MKVSVLIATYNRAALLRRALASVLRQDYADMQIVVIDDCSTDDTAAAVASFADPRIEYVRNETNIGSVAGDVAIIKRFLSEFCRGEAFVYLCDDDYWIPNDLISRQVAALKQWPSLAFAHGGMVHCYPAPAPTAAPNAPYLRYRFLDDDHRQLFWGSIYPPGLLPSRKYLRLFAEDPKNRNIVIGATMFRTGLFKACGVMDRIEGVRWQAGYAILGGAASHGDVFYMDEPCLMVEVRATTASHAGTQLTAFRETLDSIDAAFTPDPFDHELAECRSIMMRSAFQMYLCNKIGHAAGWFDTHAMGDLSKIMKPPIKREEFAAEMERRRIPLTDDNKKILEWSELPIDALKEVTWWRGVEQMAG